DLPWHDLDLSSTALQSAGSPAVPPFHYTMTFTLGGSATSTSMRLALPADFQYVTGSATLDGAPIAHPPTPGGPPLDFSFGALAAGSHSLVVGVRAGLTLGSGFAATATGTATSPSKTVSATATTSVNVIETFELNDSASDVVDLKPGVVEIAHANRS